MDNGLQLRRIQRKAVLDRVLYDPLRRIRAIEFTETIKRLYDRLNDDHRLIAQEGPHQGVLLLEPKGHLRSIRAR